MAGCALSHLLGRRARWAEGGLAGGLQELPWATGGRGGGGTMAVVVGTAAGSPPRLMREMRVSAAMRSSAPLQQA